MVSASSPESTEVRGQNEPTGLTLSFDRRLPLNHTLQICVIGHASALQWLLDSVPLSRYGSHSLNAARPMAYVFLMFVNGMLVLGWSLLVLIMT